MTTLTTYWTSEVNRITPALTDVRVHLATARTTVSLTQADSRLKSDSVRNAADLVEAARKALSTIPAPADGDPLLAAMTQALIDLHDARLAQTSAELALQTAKADEARWQAKETALVADLAEAQASLKREKAAADARQIDIDALTIGALATIATDAADALTASQTTAKARVEGEFPSKDFLKRARARGTQVATSLALRQAELAESIAADLGATAIAQGQFDAAWQAVRNVVDLAARLPDDRDTLARLAALPVATSTGFPILSLAQHELLFSATLKPKREPLLALLEKADDAYLAWLNGRSAYEKALHTAMKANPDLTLAQLNTTIVNTKKDDLELLRQARDKARTDLQKEATYALLPAWFAAVPDTLWDALEQLDLAIARLGTLKDAAGLTALLGDLVAKEDALAVALAAQRLARRTQAAADEALALSQATAQAELNAAVRRARAASRSAAPLTPVQP